MSHISFGSLKFIIPDWFMNCFAFLICSLPKKQATMGFLAFVRAFAVAKDSVIR